MNAIHSNFAVVRPRVSLPNSSDARLLEEVIAEIAEENPRAAVQIVGPAGSGKSTALCHLAAVFESDDRFAFLDQPTSDQVAKFKHLKFVVATARMGSRQLTELRLASWRADELVEYLLAKHRALCTSVMTRLGSATRRSWSPQLATILLERFAANEAAFDADFELFEHIKERIPDTAQRAVVGRICLQQLCPDCTELPPPISQLAAAGCSQEIQSLVCHSLIQLPLAAEALIGDLEVGLLAGLKKSLPYDLIQSVGQQAKTNKAVATQLERCLSTREAMEIHPMAASILFAVDGSWHPQECPRPPWRLRGGYFPDAQWSGVDLAKADLTAVDLANSNLDGACFAGTKLVLAQFQSASLKRANLQACDARGASFQAAVLQDADFEDANLNHADFTDADLSNAVLRCADLTEANLTSSCLKHANLYGAKLRSARFNFTDLLGASLIKADLKSADLRAAQLAGCNFTAAILRQAQLEDVYMPDAILREAKLQGAHLSGSHLPGGDLREANLSGAYLAEIEWEGADLRFANLKGATFHMGSSRSGLVGSPIACEGSKTGFYTDDYDDMHFKRPEEVRKANLRGADLRGARLADVDLYLVDLRDARLDEAQLVHARRCGAILEDVVA